MKLLLDTHVLIWTLRSPGHIGNCAMASMSARNNELLVSAVTPFEIATKNRLGKLPEGDRILLAYDDYLRQLGATELAMTSHHGIVAGQLKTEHRDPFDRILAAQAITENLVLVTSDAVFDSIGGVRTLWA
jgi:PIN domain nuclease of toxin-antitoxin system